MKLRNQLLLGYGMILILMIAVAAIAYRTITSLAESRIWIAHTHEVINKAHLIEKQVIDMESGERGFSITGENSFLEPYYAGTRNYRPVMKHLKKLVSDNPDQVKNLKIIDELAVEWHNKCDAHVTAMRRETTG